MSHSVFALATSRDWSRLAQQQQQQQPSATKHLLRTSTIASYGRDKVIVAGMDGSLHIFQSDLSAVSASAAPSASVAALAATAFPAIPPNSLPHINWRHIHVIQGFAQKPIDQLIIIEEERRHIYPSDTHASPPSSPLSPSPSTPLALLLSLSEGIVRMHLLPSFTLLGTLDKAKGVILMAANKSSHRFHGLEEHAAIQHSAKASASKSSHRRNGTFGAHQASSASPSAAPFIPLSLAIITDKSRKLLHYRWHDSASSGSASRSASAFDFQLMNQLNLPDTMAGNAISGTSQFPSQPSGVAGGLVGCSLNLCKSSVGLAAAVKEAPMGVKSMAFAGASTLWLAYSKHYYSIIFLQSGEKMDVSNYNTGVGSGGNSGSGSGGNGGNKFSRNGHDSSNIQVASIWHDLDQSSAIASTPGADGIDAPPFGGQQQQPPSTIHPSRRSFAIPFGSASISTPGHTSNPSMSSSVSAATSALSVAAQVHSYRDMVVIDDCCLLFYTCDGKPKQGGKNILVFSDQVVSFTLYHTYVIALLANHTIEIKSLHTRGVSAAGMDVIQTFHLQTSTSTSSSSSSSAAGTGRHASTPNPKDPLTIDPPKWFNHPQPHLQCLPVPLPHPHSPNAHATPYLSQPLLILSSFSILRAFIPVPIHIQLQQLVDTGLFKDAIALVDQSTENQWHNGLLVGADREREREREERDSIMSSTQDGQMDPDGTLSPLAQSKSAALNHLRVLYGYHLFNHGSYSDAMACFQQTDADPLQILSLFPDVLPSSLLAQSNGQTTGEDQTNSGETPSPFASLAPFSFNHPVPVQKVSGEQSLFMALSALIPYLAQIQNRLRLSLEEVFGGSSSNSSNGTQAQREQMTNGTNNLNTTQHSPSSNNIHSQQSTSSCSKTQSNLALAILVDTVLLKAYLLCDIPLLPFLSSPYNLTDIDECANILRAYEKYVELVAFFKYRARHAQALELLARLGQQSSASPAASGSGGNTNGSGVAALSGTEPTVRYLQELCINIHQPCFPLPGLDNDRTINHSSNHDSLLSSAAYLPASLLEGNSSSVIALILDYSKWVLATDVDEGLRIFTYCHTLANRPVERKASASSSSASSSNSSLRPTPDSPSHVSLSTPHTYASHCANCIPPALVLDHLKQHADREACMAYLESLITNLDEREPLFHNELIFLYLEAIQKIMSAQEQQMKAANGSAAAVGEVGEKEALQSIREVPVRGRKGKATNSTKSDHSAPSPTPPSSLSPSFPSQDSSRLSILRRKLLHFLRSSPSYAAEKMLTRFPRNALLHERAILLARINQHTQALNIYAHRLHDHVAAEAYAEECYMQAMAAAAQRQAGAAAGATGHTGSMHLPLSNLSPTLIAEGHDMYLKLLQVYLKPPPPDLDHLSAGADPIPAPSPGPLLDPALQLLFKYADRISPIAALEILPPQTPIGALQPYFEKLLARLTHEYRDEQIVKQLLKSEFFAVKEEHLLAACQRVVIDTVTQCWKCKKKIGNSAFARYPNGQIVHYVCHQLSVQNSSSSALQKQGDL